MFKNILPSKPPVEDDDDHGLEGLIDVLPDIDPSIVQMRQIDEENANLASLRKYVAASEDAASLIAFANQDGSLAVLAPAVESIGDNGVDKESVLSQIDARLGEDDPPVLNLLKFLLRSVAALGAILLAFSGIVALLAGSVVTGLAYYLGAYTIFWAIREAGLDAAKKFKAVPFKDLLRVAEGIGESVGAILNLFKLNPPANKTEADALIKQLVKEGKAFSAIGISVAESGVTVSDLPKVVEGADPKTLGYSDTSLSDIAKPAKVGVEKFIASKGVVKSSVSSMQAKLKQLDKQKDLTKDDADAIRKAVTLHLEVLSAVTNRIGKASKFIHSELKSVHKQAYKKK